MNKVMLMASLLLLWGFHAQAQHEVGKWKIKGGQITEDHSTNLSLAKKYWNTLYTMLPTDLIDKYVTSFRLFTDGEEEDMGGINQMDETVNFWEIDLDTADMNIFTKDSVEILKYTHTLIHEFGHLLTLNPTQIELTDDIFQNDAKGYLTSEGYALKDSYLGVFVQQFWDIGMLSAWDKIDKKKNESKRVDLLYDFYLSFSDEFVNDYAAESPEEDIAESWTFFVLCDKPEKNSVKLQKVKFFYQFPKLVKYREKIRSNIRFIPTSYMENYVNSWE